jgi:WD40 repeat protein
MIYLFILGFSVPCGFLGSVTCNLHPTPLEPKLGVLRHEDRVTCLAFSPDGKVLASGAGGSNDCCIRLWDIESAKLLFRLDGYENHVYTVAFSPDGKKLASGGREKQVRIWDAGNGKEIRRLKGYEHYVNRVSFSNDGKLLVTASDDKTARLWEVENGKELRQFGNAALPTHGVAFSPDGKTVAVSDVLNLVYLFDTQSGKEIRRIDKHKFRVPWVRFSPDGKTLATVSFDKTVCLWEVESGKEIREFKHDGLGLAGWSADGKVLAIVVNNKIELVDLEEGKVIRKFPAPPRGEPFTALAFSSDGKFIAASGWEDNIIRVWDVNTGKRIR